MAPHARIYLGVGIFQPAPRKGPGRDMLHVRERFGPQGSSSSLTAPASTGGISRLRLRHVAAYPSVAGDRSVSVVVGRDPSEWNLLVDQPGGAIYHRWEWLSWIAPLLSSRFVPLLVKRAGRPVGIAPLLVRRQFGLASANIVPFPYLGPVVPPELITAATDELLNWARRRGVISLELCLHPDLSAADGSLNAAGLAEERVDTFMIDLTGRNETDLFAQLGGDARTAIRRSVKQGVTIRRSNAEDLRTVLPAVHDESLGEHSKYAAAIGDAVAGGTLPMPARCATAVVGGRPVGVSITLAGGPEAVGWLGAVYRADQRTQANAALIWDAITWAAAEGYDSLDMCGAPDAGIAVYKRKFRPRIEQHLMGRWQAHGLVSLRRLQTHR